MATVQALQLRRVLVQTGAPEQTKSNVRSFHMDVPHGSTFPVIKFPVIKTVFIQPAS